MMWGGDRARKRRRECHLTCPVLPNTTTMYMSVDQFTPNHSDGALGQIADIRMEQNARLNHFCTIRCFKYITQIVTGGWRICKCVISLLNCFVFLLFLVSGKEAEKAAIIKFLHYRVVAGPVCQLNFQKADSKRPKLNLKSQQAPFLIHPSLSLSPPPALSSPDTLPAPKQPTPPHRPRCVLALRNCHSPSFAFFEDFPDGVFLQAVLFRNLSMRKEKCDEFH